METDIHNARIRADTMLNIASTALYELRCLGRTYVGTIEKDNRRTRIYVDMEGTQIGA